MAIPPVSDGKEEPFSFIAVTLAEIVEPQGKLKSGAIKVAIGIKQTRFKTIN
jgi:hypothetical protein